MTFEDRRFDYGERRFITMGVLRGNVEVIATAEDEKPSGSYQCERRSGMKKIKGLKEPVK